MNKPTNFQQFEKLQEEQLPVAKHKLHDWTHFAGLYAAEHVAATEFVIGATLRLMKLVKNDSIKSK